MTNQISNESSSEERRSMEELVVGDIYECYYGYNKYKIEVKPKVGLKKDKDVLKLERLKGSYGKGGLTKKLLKGGLTKKLICTKVGDEEKRVYEIPKKTDLYKGLVKLNYVGAVYVVRGKDLAKIKTLNVNTVSGDTTEVAKPEEEGKKAETTPKTPETTPKTPVKKPDGPVVCPKPDGLYVKNGSTLILSPTPDGKYFLNVKDSVSNGSTEGTKPYFLEEVYKVELSVSNGSTPTKGKKATPEVYEGAKPECPPLCRRVRILDNSNNISNSLKSNLNVLLNQHGSIVSDEEIYHLLSKMFIKEKIDTTKTDFAKKILEISFKDSKKIMTAEFKKIFMNFLNENNVNSKIFDSNEKNNNSLPVNNHNGLIGFVKSIL